MPRQWKNHWNPANHTGQAGCGRVLSRIQWTASIEDVDCNTCLKVIARRQAEADAAQKAKG